MADRAIPAGGANGPGPDSSAVKCVLGAAPVQPLAATTVQTPMMTRSVPGGYEPIGPSDVTLKFSNVLCEPPE